MLLAKLDNPFAHLFGSPKGDASNTNDSAHSSADLSQNREKFARILNLEVRSTDEGQVLDDRIQELRDEAQDHKDCMAEKGVEEAKTPHVVIGAEGFTATERNLGIKLKKLGKQMKALFATPTRDAIRHHDWVEHSTPEKMRAKLTAQETIERRAEIFELKATIKDQKRKYNTVNGKMIILRKENNNRTPLDERWVRSVIVIIVTGLFMASVDVAIIAGILNSNAFGIPEPLIYPVAVALGALLAITAHLLGIALHMGRNLKIGASAMSILMWCLIIGLRLSSEADTVDNLLLLAVGVVYLIGVGVSWSYHTHHLFRLYERQLARASKNIIEAERRLAFLHQEVEDVVNLTMTDFDDWRDDQLEVYRTQKTELERRCRDEIRLLADAWVDGVIDYRSCYCEQYAVVNNNQVAPERWHETPKKPWE